MADQVSDKAGKQGSGGQGTDQTGGQQDGTKGGDASASGDAGDSGDDDDAADVLAGDVSEGDDEKDPADLLAGDTGDDADDNVVPEKYDLKIPEGLPFGDGWADKVAEMAKANKWSQKQAQQVVDFSAQTIRDMGSNALKQNKDSIAVAQKQWISELKSDPQFGKESYQTTISDASKFLSKFTDKDTRQLLKASGLITYPGLVKAWALAYKGVGEDEIGTGGSGTKREPQDADVFFPTMVKK